MYMYIVNHCFTSLATRAALCELNVAHWVCPATIAALNVAHWVCPATIAALNVALSLQH